MIMQPRHEAWEQFQKRKKEEEEKTKPSPADFAEFEVNPETGELIPIKSNIDIKKNILNEEFKKEWEELNKRHQELLIEMQQQEEELKKMRELGGLAEEAKDLIKKINERERELKAIEEQLKKIKE